jgi:hypothetical protein
MTVLLRPVAADQQRLLDRAALLPTGDLARHSPGGLLRRLLPEAQVVAERVDPHGQVHVAWLAEQQWTVTTFAGLPDGDADEAPCGWDDLGWSLRPLALLGAVHCRVGPSGDPLRLVEFLLCRREAGSTGQPAHPGVQPGVQPAAGLDGRVSWEVWRLAALHAAAGGVPGVGEQVRVLLALRDPHLAAWAGRQAPPAPRPVPATGEARAGTAVKTGPGAEVGTGRLVRRLAGLPGALIEQCADPAALLHLLLPAGSDVRQEPAPDGWRVWWRAHGRWQATVFEPVADHDDWLPGQPWHQVPWMHRLALTVRALAQTEPAGKPG